MTYESLANVMQVMGRKVTLLIPILDLEGVQRGVGEQRDKANKRKEGKNGDLVVHGWCLEIKGNKIIVEIDFCSLNNQQDRMSFHPGSHHVSGTHRLTEFVPNYVPHSDYLPSNRVTDNQHEANQWLSNYEQQKRLGHVYSSKPQEFDPRRYVSVRTYENVHVNKPISESEFNSRVRRY